MSTLTKKAISVIDGLLKLSPQELSNRINAHVEVGYGALLEGSGYFKVGEELSTEWYGSSLNSVQINEEIFESVWLDLQQQRNVLTADYNSIFADHSVSLSAVLMNNHIAQIYEQTNFNEVYSAIANVEKNLMRIEGEYASIVQSLSVTSYEPSVVKLSDNLIINVTSKETAETLCLLPIAA